MKIFALNVACLICAGRDKRGGRGDGSAAAGLAVAYGSGYYRAGADFDSAYGYA